MDFVVAGLIVLLVLYLAVQPFTKQKQYWVTDSIEEDTHKVSLNEVYATLNELEMEYNMGKLAEDDYQSLKRKYEAVAVEKIREDEQKKKTIDYSGSEADQMDETDLEIEKELEEMRKLRKGK